MATTTEVGRRLLVTQGISEAGDFVGLSALLLLAYRGSGNAIGPGAVFAARTLPSVCVGTALGGVLERPERRRTLVSLAVTGAVAMGAAAGEPTVVVALIVAAVLGGTRTAAIGITTSIVSNAIPEGKRHRYFALSTSINQTCQIMGFLAGTTASLSIGIRPALAFDAATFVVAAVSLGRLPRLPGHVAGRWPGPSQGVRTIAANPVLRTVAPVVLATTFATALPETIGTAVVHGHDLAVVLAAFPFGMTAAAVLATRFDFMKGTERQLRIALVFAAGLAVGSAALWATSSPWALAAANVLLGAASIWLTGARTTFANETPCDRMAQVEATMVASINLTEGLGALSLAFLAAAIGPSFAYLTACLVVAAFGVQALRESARGARVLRSAKPSLTPS